MVVSENPYRAGTKMAAVFDLFNDGRGHTVGEVVPLIISIPNSVNARTRRTAGSFIRTLRRKFEVVIDRRYFTEYTLICPKES